MQLELIVTQRRAQAMLHLDPRRQGGIHLQAMMQIRLAGGLSLFQRGFRVLHELVRLAAVIRIKGEAALGL